MVMCGRKNKNCVIYSFVQVLAGKGSKGVIPFAAPQR